MKKKILTVTLALFSLVAVSQTTTHNALGLGNNPYITSAALFSQTFYEGSARTSAMGNAFISLGGDIGSLGINPAASGIYRYSEFSVTPALSIFTGKTEYLNESSLESKKRLVIPSLGYVGNLFPNRKGNNSISISFAVNRINDFNSRFSANGSTDQSSWLGAVASGTNGTLSSELDITSTTDTYPFTIGLPWKNVLAWNTNLLDLLSGTTDEYIGATENLDGELIYTGGLLNQSFVRETFGSQTEILVNVGGRIGTKLFFGANLGIQSLFFTDYQKYTESADNSSNFQTGFQSMDYTYRQSTNGIGLNAKLGLIFVPFSGFRIGATITTPTFMSITEEWEEEMTSRFSDGYQQTVLSPVGDFTYGLISPLKLGAGVSYVFGNFAIISADLEGVSYSMTRLSKSENGIDQFSNENSIISDDFRLAKNFRVGAEVKPVKNFALRAGYSYYQNADKNNPNDYTFISAGAGFNNNSGFFMDLSVQQRLENKESLKLYESYSGISSPTGLLTSGTTKIFMTVGFRF
jgi:hypothetical protein